MKDASIQALEDVGLSTKEATVYLGLLSLGEATVGQIAERTKLKRPILYVVLEGLVRNGYVSEIPNQHVRRFVAGDPSRVYHHIAAGIDNLKYMLPVLRSVQVRSGKFPRIEVFENTESITAVYRNVETSQQARFITSYSHLQQYFPREVERWVRRGQNENDTNRSWHILARDKQSMAFAHGIRGNTRHHFRFLPAEVTVSMDLAITDRMVSITSFEPMFLVLIHSERIANTMASIFDMAWKQASQR